MGGHHAAEADMRHAGIGAASVSRAGAVARAILIVAQERAAALGALRHERLPGIEAALRAGWVHDDLAICAMLVQLAVVPIAAPLPDIARRVEQAVAVGRKRFHRCRADETVGGRVLVRELALPEIGMIRRVGGFLVTPAVRLAIESPARRTPTRPPQ